MKKKKISFYRIISILFFIMGLIFGIFAITRGSETGIFYLFLQLLFHGFYLLSSAIELQKNIEKI